MKHKNQTSINIQLDWTCMFDCSPIPELKFEKCYCIVVIKWRGIVLNLDQL